MRKDPELMEVKSSVPARKFVMVYLDMLKAKSLTWSEKVIFIVLKSFITFGRDEGEVFPSMETICEMSGMSRSTATRVIDSLVLKGFVKKKRQGVMKPNIYTIADYPAMWEVAATKEERAEILDSLIPFTSDQLVEELVRRGVLTKDQKDQIAGKKNGPVSAATENDPNEKIITNVPTNQDFNQFIDYSQEYIHNIYSYDVLAKSLYDKPSLDAIMEILYASLNSHKKTIRVGGDDKPADVVKGKLLKLDSDDIQYAIVKYKTAKGRVKKPKEYMLTILYGAKEQRVLDAENSKSYYRALIYEEQNPEEEEQVHEEATSKNAFCRFPQNSYGWDELEAELANTE